MRVFIFGIDGLTMRIMKPLMDKGIIPNFKSIYESGNRGILKSTIPPFTPPGWASIYTGKNPGKHGLFQFQRRKGYSHESNTCWNYKEAPPVWKHLSNHGKKCVLLNVPMYYPPLRLQNCCSVSGFNAIETFNIYHPESLRHELLEKVPDYRIDSSWRHDFPENKKEVYIKDNIEVTKSRIKALNYLMKEKAWDFFFVVFTGTDRMQHFFWDEIINGVPEIIQYYKLLDDAIGLVLDSLRKEDFLLIVSDHGFCPIQKNININKVLEQHGLLSIKKTVEIPINYEKLRKTLGNLGIKKGLRSILPQRLINKVQEHTMVEGAFSFQKVDWNSTKAFASSGIYGGIDINLKGREPSGIISESEYDNVRDYIAEVFSSLIDVNNGDKKAIQNIYKRENIYSGKHLYEMPDLVLLAETGYRFDQTISREDVFSESRGGANQHIMQGEHEVDSIFMFKHDSFNKKFNKVSVIDIAPSVLNIFDIPIPTSIDGEPLFEEYKPPRYIDELTGVIFMKQGKSSLNIKSKLKNL